MENEKTSKAAAVLAHPVTKKVLTAVSYGLVLGAGIAFGERRGQKKALEESGLPTAN